MTDAHDITGGLDLLGDWLDAKGFTEEAALCTRAMDEINRLRETMAEETKDSIAFIRKQADEIVCLHQAMHDIYEVYAGSEGFKPETCPEAYLQDRIKEMAYIAGKHKRAGGGND